MQKYYDEIFDKEDHDEQYNDEDWKDGDDHYEHRSLLAEAIEEGKINVVEYLVGLGLSLKSCPFILTLAARDGQLDMLNYLISMKSYPYNEEEICDALDAAVQERHMHIIKYIKGLGSGR